MCSFVKDYIDKNIGEDITTLYIFSDGCAGQNKNNTVVRFLLSLVDTGRFKQIIQIFPFRGHSFLPCDRDFGLIKRKVKKSDRVYSVDDYTTMMKEARRDNPFTIVNVSYEDVLNFKNWWPKYYKISTSSADKRKWSISTYKMMIFSNKSPGTVIAYELIDGLVETSFFLLKTKKTKVQHGMKSVYGQDGVAINVKKLKDIEKLLQYIPEEHLGFYSDIIAWKSIDKDNLDDHDDDD